MPRTYKQFIYEQRLELKSMLDNGLSAVEIAQKLGVHNSSVYREMKRGFNGTEYDPDYAEEQYQKKLHEKGPERVVSKHPALAQFISDCILVEKLSPERIANRILSDERFSKTPLSEPSIYSAIYAGLIPGVTKETLYSKTVKMYGGGSIIVPTWMRNQYGFNDGDTFIIEIECNRIVLTKQE